MTALLRRVPHMPGEAATSYASRLAACNGVDLATFCRHMGLTVTGLVTGRREALETLAMLGGVAPDTLRHDAIVRVDERRWSLRGQSLSSGTLRRLRPRFLPALLGRRRERDRPAHATGCLRAVCMESRADPHLRSPPRHAVGPAVRTRLEGRA